MAKTSGRTVDIEALSFKELSGNRLPMIRDGMVHTNHTVLIIVRNTNKNRIFATVK